MAQNLGQLLAEADALISSKTSQVKTASAAPKASDEVQKLAQALLASGAQEKTAEPSEEPTLGIGFSKTAEALHALALVETLINLPTLTKIAKLEEKAEETGLGTEKVAEFIEKNASAFPMRSVFELMPWAQQHA